MEDKSATKFDPERFENLPIFEAAKYAVDLGKGHITEDEFMPYFQQRAGSLDWPRLELAVYLLGRVGTNRAMHAIADYLGHPNINIRYVAINAVRSLPAIDELVMKKVVESLSKSYDYPMHSALNEELKIVLNRPANSGASSIAAKYGGHK